MKQKFLFVIFSISILLAFSFLITSCSEDSTTEPPTTPSNVPMAKLSEIQSKVFNISCATANCHASGTAAGGLILSDGQSYNNLINVESILYPGVKRVDEGNSDESLLVQIITGTRIPRMPLNASPLPAGVIDSIAKWIDLGAPNN
ncbi:MAG TPA: hypothetical protein VK870_06270 [Ignavibacteriaceae bacterium]|nr:hypothetical protein [Ignavibacteriaceae bacterium]